MYGTIIFFLYSITYVLRYVRYLEYFSVFTVDRNRLYFLRPIWFYLNYNKLTVVRQFNYDNFSNFLSASTLGVWILFSSGYSFFDWMSSVYCVHGSALCLCVYCPSAYGTNAILTKIRIHSYTTQLIIDAYTLTHSHTHTEMPPYHTTHEFRLHAANRYLPFLFLWIGWLRTQKGFNITITYLSLFK